MITEIVSFTTPEHFTRAEMLEDAAGTIARWRDFPGLVRKLYLWDAAARRGMGIYLWQTLADAQRAHDEAWLQRAEAHWGMRPTLQRLDCLMILENPGGEVSRPAPG